jgi:hypothetical protein
MSSRHGRGHQLDDQISSDATSPIDPRVDTNEQLDALEEQNEEEVTPLHLFLALDHVVELLNTHGISYAVMGGLHMVLRGYVARTTKDVDIAVETRPKPLLEALAEDER